MQDHSLSRRFWIVRRPLTKTLLRLSFILALLATATFASATATWQVQNAYPANDGTWRVFWIKPGTTDVNGNYSGDTASVWSVNAQGVETAIGPNYGPYAGWKLSGSRVAPDGTSRLNWIKSGTTDNTGQHYTGDTVAVWTLNSHGVETAIGPNYGPYLGWHINYFDVARDNTVHLYWNTPGPGGTAASESISVWRLNSAGVALAQGPTYGPYPGWQTYNAQEAADGTLRLQWVKLGTYDNGGAYSGDQIAVWTLNTNGTETSIGPNYGPYAGWTAASFFVAPDNTSRLEWVKSNVNFSTGTDTGDLVSVWTLNASGVALAMGPTYGPYPNWRSYGMKVAPDNTSHLFWVIPGTTDGSGNNTTGDKVSFWTVDNKGVATAAGPAYGPYSGWATNYFSIAPDGTNRLGWIKRGTTDANSQYSGDTTSTWTINSSGTATAIGPSYGPYLNWSAHIFSPATGDLTFLVWQHNGQIYTEGDGFSLWSLNAVGSATLIGPSYGPY